jgi:hypothetical protein
MADVISSSMLDRFCTAAGPARLTLLSPVRPLLDGDAEPPIDSFDCLIPLRSLLEAARDGTTILDNEAGLEHSYAIRLNARLGFDSPAWFEGGRTHLEVDTLLHLTRTMGATLPGDGHEILVPIGSNMLDDPVALWRAAAWAVPAIPCANQQIADIWELILAWLLIEGEEFEAQYAALTEVVEGEDDIPEIFNVATCSLYTMARALNMFVPRPRHILKKPVLNEFGRATAIEALRSAVTLKWNDFRSIA